MNSKVKQKRKAVIVTALGLELEAVLNHLDNVAEEQDNNQTIYEVGEFVAENSVWHIAACETGMTNYAAAQATERVLSRYNPEVALFVGIAGGLKDVNLGDVVVGSKIYGFEVGKDENSFKPRPDVGQPDYGMLERAKKVARTNEWQNRIKAVKRRHPNAFIGPIAAGEKVVASTNSLSYKLIKENYSDALAVAMEDRGFTHATWATSKSNATHALVIRGISDLVKGKTESDEQGWQPMAAANASAFAFEILAKLPQLTKNIDAGSNLVNVLSLLYPSGPTEKAIFSRAGGDLSRLNLQADGRTQWFGAIETLQKGGGQTTLEDLLNTALIDFPENQDLILIKGKR